MRRPILLSLLAAVVAAGCGLAGSRVPAAKPAASATTLDDYVRQFRTTSGPVGLLGSYGKKRGDARGHPYFRYGMLAWADSNNVSIGRFRLGRDGLISFAAGLQGGSASVGALSTDSALSHYEVSLIDIGDLMKLAETVEATMERDERMGRYLEHPDARIVTGVVLAHGVLRQSSGQYDSLGVQNVLGERGKVQVVGAGRDSVSASIAGSIVIGYRLVRICWDPAGRIEFKEDIAGRGDRCEHHRPAAAARVSGTR